MCKKTCDALSNSVTCAWKLENQVQKLISLCRITVGCVFGCFGYGMLHSSPLLMGFTDVDLADHHFHGSPHYCCAVRCHWQRFLMDCLIISFGERRLYTPVGQDQRYLGKKAYHCVCQCPLPSWQSDLRFGPQHGHYHRRSGCSRYWWRWHPYLGEHQCL
jgi:hypothetical protein